MDNNENKDKQQIKSTTSRAEVVGPILFFIIASIIMYLAARYLR